MTDGLKPYPQFKKDDKDEPTKMAIAMFSGEKEKVMMDGEVRYLVELPHPCPHRGRRLVVITSLNVPMQVSCDGAVESWLQNVVDGMRAALSKEFCESVVAYNEARVYTLL